MQAQSEDHGVSCTNSLLRADCIAQELCNSCHRIAAAASNAATGGSGEVGAARRARGPVKPCSMRRARSDTMQPSWTSSRRYQYCRLSSPKIDESRRHAFDTRLGFVQALEIVPGRLYMAALKTVDGLHRSSIAQSSITYCIDSELVRSSAEFTAFSMVEAQCCRVLPSLDCLRFLWCLRCMSPSTQTLVP